MEAWPRLLASFSSLPTTTTTSPSSSSSSLHPPLLLDLADQLWFFESVFPLPSFSLPCLPSLFSSSPHSPDPSTLLAQLMFSSSVPLPSLSSSCSSSAPPLPPLPSHFPPLSHWGLPPYTYPVPSLGDEDDDAYSYYTPLGDSDDDALGYACPDKDEDEYHVYACSSDDEDEDAYHDYPVHIDIAKEEETHVTNCEKPQLGDATYVEAEDALAGMHDVHILLKDLLPKDITEEVSNLELPESRPRNAEFLDDARERRKTDVETNKANTQDMASHGDFGLQNERLGNRLTASNAPYHREVMSQVSALPQIHVLSINEQADMKERLKLWAHTVASTLPWKAAAQARPVW